MFWSPGPLRGWASRASRSVLNATDALILRSALDIAGELHSLILVASDRRLLRAAESEGLQVLNPEETSLERLAEFETGRTEE